jgi:hypothetical protein
MNLFRASFLFVAVLCFASCTQQVKPSWPTITSETKPWTRWWWPGSAVTKEGITSELETFAKAGLGGVEITPIYGVMGAEDRFVSYLSPQWIELLIHTLKEAERLDLGVDMATGTGWPFGGPWVSEEDASKNINYKIYDVKGGERLSAKIEFIQPPFLRAVGNQVYEVHQSFSTEQIETKGNRKEPLARLDPKNIDINKLQQPVSANKNLQELALDQVQFEKAIPLVALTAYSANGDIIQLTNKVSPDGHLDWVAPDGNWKVYALFQGAHGKMVERAGPGGEGNVIDHFSLDALNNYLATFDSAFNNKDIRSLRSFFNDSYEVDDARGAADWTPSMLQEFKKRRGYLLEDHLPALVGAASEEENVRILYDYRLTVAELLQTNFTERWTSWAHDHSALVRNQAHGSPANILDLYSTVDIPEIEGVDPLRIRMASSAGNVSGKKLVSSESATWLNEHFESNLGDIKSALDRFMLNGVNHIFYHGTCYSPAEEPWPGYLFYAAVHLNNRNPLWNDFDALNLYVARCQSMLQNSTSDNEVLLYFPFADVLAVRGPEMVQHIDGISEPLRGSMFEAVATMLMDGGTGFDYVSDRQIMELMMKDGRIVTSGGARYQSIVVPPVDYMPVETLQQLADLAANGASILFVEAPPLSYAGFDKNNAISVRFDSTLSYINRLSRQENATIAIIPGLPTFAGSEPMVEKGLAFVRKTSTNGHTIYMITNQGETIFDGDIQLSKNASDIMLYNPMTGVIGKAIITAGEKPRLLLQLLPGETIFAELYQENVESDLYPYLKPSGTPVTISNGWAIKFIDGGPTMPASITTDSLTSWDRLSDEHKSFSGTATYQVSFEKPRSQGLGYWLDLGEVHESAEISVNGTLVGTLIGPVYRIYLDSSLIKATNTLEVTVSNLMANRIGDLDRRQVFWKKFYNINFPARRPGNRKGTLFDASGWTPRRSGLVGPVQLTVVAQQ